jgi:hypothetical protein
MDERRGNQRRASDCNDSIVERLAQPVQHMPCAFGQLVEEEDAMVRQRHLPGHGDLAAANQADVGDGVVWGAERPGGDTGGRAGRAVGRGPRSRHRSPVRRVRRSGGTRCSRYPSSRLPFCPNPCLLPRRSACQPLSAGMPAISAATSPRLPGNGRPRACCVLDRRHMICIAMRAARGYHVVLYRSTRLIRRENGRDATSGFDSTRPPGKGP